MEANVGSYSVHPMVGQKEMAIFMEAMKGNMGMELKPVAVASQLVNGVNYIYICTGAPVVAHPVTKLYAVKIYTKFSHSVAPTMELEQIKEIDAASLV